MKINKRKKLLYIKKRFILLNIVAIIFIFSAASYIIEAGDSYELSAFEADSEHKVVDVAGVFENEGVVEISGFYCNESGEVIVRLQSLTQGRTGARLYAEFDDGTVTTDYETSFFVSISGTIIEQNEFYVNFSGFQVILWLFLGYLALALGVMLFSFIECVKTAAYSYRMIAYGGISMFLSTTLMILGYMLYSHDFFAFSKLIALIAEAGEWFLLIMLVPMAVSAVAVSVSNIRLMRCEGYRPVNALGIAISIVWLASLAVMAMANDFRVSLYFEEGGVQALWYLMTLVVHFIAYLIAYFESMLISTALCAFLASRHIPPQDRDYIIILGCAIRKDGSLTPLLRGRVDAALRFEKSQYAATGKHAGFVPSGGQGSDEIISEGEAMENYLLEQGVEPGRILREDKSVNTFENMQLSKRLIDNHDAESGNKKYAFATTNYHIFRGYILSKKNGFDAQGISAKTKWYFFPNAFLREFIGLLYDQKLRHLTVIVLFILAAAALGLIY